jgi:hypothetical protein
MKSLSKNKKALTTLELILVIVVMFVALSFLIDPNGGIPIFIKRLFGMGSEATDAYKICYLKPDGYACRTKEIPDGACINSMCTFKNSAATSLEHAKLLFKTTLKQDLEKCKTDATGCAEASAAVINILAYVDSDDEGNVFLVIQDIEGPDTELRLYKKQGFWSSLFGSSPNVASFRHTGDFCFKKKANANSDLSVDSGVSKKGIGKEPNGVFVFDTGNPANEKAWDNYLSISKDGNNICLNYAART